jgi:hypothetical protein
MLNSNTDTPPIPSPLALAAAPLSRMLSMRPWSLRCCRWHLLHHHRRPQPQSTWMVVCGLEGAAPVLLGHAFSRLGLCQDVPPFGHLYLHPLTHHDGCWFPFTTFKNQIYDLEILPSWGVSSSTPPPYRWKKFEQQTFRDCQTLELWYRMCLHLRLFKKFKILNLKICEFRKYLI